MNKPVVSVLIPAYKQAEYVAECLDSLIAQTYRDWEAVVVDDGSPDDVAAAVAPYVRKDGRIRFCHTDNRGVSAARNYAASITSGEYILPLDADDTIEPTYIEKCVAWFSEHPETDLVYCRWRYFGASTHTPEVSYRNFRELLLINTIFCTSLFRRSDFERVGGYDEKMRDGLEDWEFLMRLLSPESVVCQIPEQLFNYRIKDVSRNVEALRGERRKSCFRYIYSKHAGLYEQCFGNPMLAMHRLYFDAQKYKRKYYGVWYRRLWYGLFPKKTDKKAENEKYLDFDY